VDLRCCAEGCAYLKDLAECAEFPALRRLTAAVERLFHVPVAYIALLGRGVDVARRIGSGQQYWPFLNALPKPRLLEAPLIVPDTAARPPEGLDCRDLRFIASAPLRAAGGLPIGALLIADRGPRPGFAEADAQALAELAELLAARIELRAVVCHALDSERALREAERRFEAIANAAPVLMACSDAHGACVFVNLAWLEFTGRTLADELGDGWLDPIHRDHREALRQAYWTAFQARQPFQAQALMRRRDGQYRWVLARAAPRFREDGGFAGMAGCVADITDSHDAVQEVAKLSQCAAAIGQAAGLAHFILDRDGRIERLCPRGQGMTPPGEAGLLGQFLWDILPPSDASIRWAVQRSACSRSAVSLDLSGRRWSFTPLTEETGGVIALAAILQTSAVQAPAAV
jgi:PAS domain S-box-containing protein